MKLKIRDISSALKEKTSGWVAINTENKVVEFAKSFDELCKKVEFSKDKLTLVPAAKNYFGYITGLHELI